VPINVYGITPFASHQLPSRAPVLMAAASVSAPAALTSPAPCVRRSVPGILIALYCSIALTRFGVSAASLWNPA